MTNILTIEQNGESLRVMLGKQYVEKTVNPRLSLLVDNEKVIGCEWKDQHMVWCNVVGSIGSNGCSCFSGLKSILNENNVGEFINGVVECLGDVKG